MVGAFAQVKVLLSCESLMFQHLERKPFLLLTNLFIISRFCFLLSPGEVFGKHDQCVRRQRMNCLILLGMNVTQLNKAEKTTWREGTSVLSVAIFIFCMLPLIFSATFKY